MASVISMLTKLTSLLNSLFNGAITALCQTVRLIRPVQISAQKAISILTMLPVRPFTAGK